MCVCFSGERKFERIERIFKLYIPDLRQYNEKATRAFMKDLSDGFFPSELQVSAIWLRLKIDFCFGHEIMLKIKIAHSLGSKKQFRNTEMSFI